MRIAHIIGNGDSAQLYTPSPGFKITCNLPPFEVRDVYTTCIVDFKMMRAIAEGSVVVPGEWVLGARPKMFCERNPMFHLKHAGQIKEFYTELPKYANDYTAFNCGHMATYFSIRRLKADQINMYGFDSMFNANLRSYSDLFLPSDRHSANNARLASTWRPIWQQMFAEHSNIEFVIHNKTNSIQFNIPDNVRIQIH